MRDAGRRLRRWLQLRLRLRLTDVVHWLTAFVFTIAGAVTLIGNQIRAQGNDAVFTQSLVNRAQRFGGTYYQNGISPKGPLEDVAHDIALRVGGYDGHFYVISIMVAVSAALIGAAAARTALTTGGNRHVALAVAAVVFLHFTLSNAAYSGLLYSRNLLVTLFAVAWLITLDDRAWQGSLKTQWTIAMVTGALLGLGVQTIIPSFIDASAIGIAALVLMAPRVENRARRTKLRIAIVAAAAGALASAPIWYQLRGSFSEFWASWWTYASYQNLGSGLTFGQELGRGWNNAYSYYQDRPLLFLMILAFIGLTVAAWPNFDRKIRVLHLALLGWLGGGWFQLVSGVRYSTHYFSVIAAPTAMIGAALAGHAFAALARVPRVSRTTVAWPLIGVLLTFYLSAGTTTRLRDAASITSNFTSVQRSTSNALQRRPGPDRSVQAVLDLVSRDRDALLAYSDDQFLYPEFRRVPATRFQQRYFLIGAIYLGETSSKYILRNTWNWFRDDLRETNPAAFLQTQPIDSKPFAAYVAGHFKTVFTGSAGTVELRDDLAGDVINGTTGSDWTPPAKPSRGSGWSVDANAAHFTQASPRSSADRFVLANRSCQRVDGTLDDGPLTSPHAVFHIQDASGRTAELQLAFDGTDLTVENAKGIALDTTDTDAPSVGSVDFSLVIGRRSAVLVMRGKIVGAVAIPDHVEVTLESGQPALAVENLRVGKPPPGSGC